MPACIHDDICRAWMKKTNSIAPYSNICPRGCEYFERKEIPRTPVYQPTVDELLIRLKGYIND